MMIDCEIANNFQHYFQNFMVCQDDQFQFTLFMALLGQSLPVSPTIEVPQVERKNVTIILVLLTLQTRET